ncbi:hypothetical protein [Paenibacillus sp. NPDC055715]
MTHTGAASFKGVSDDLKMKQQYYPKLDKRNFFKLGFIAFL